MDCKTYKALYDKYRKFPLEQSISDTTEHEEHTEHFHECESCGEWTMRKDALAKGVNPDEYCCASMAYHLSTGVGVDVYDDPDVIMIHVKKFDEYGIPIQDGGTSFIQIHYCPWCGSKLPKSKRD